MREILSVKLHSYLQQNHPDVWMDLESEGTTAAYICQKMDAVEPFLRELLDEQRPGYIIEELCMTALTRDLGPSRYSYIKELLEDEFLIEYHQLLRLGILSFEIVNIITACGPLFEAFGFSEENEDDRNLRYTITGTIREYFEPGEKENREIWPTTLYIN